MPVLERGVGLDRSFYKLPVLLLEDFAFATPQLIRQVLLFFCRYSTNWKIIEISSVCVERKIVVKVHCCTKLH
jgi:hypothetical protein